MFPFDEPAPTAFYLVLYLGTMVLHVVPMNYVLAGSATLAFLAGWETITKRTVEAHASIAATLRDWLPLGLSVAITAGVAPLLFLQVLYKEPFYTANLLLFHRWMLILPVLIAAFYLLYVQKLKRLVGGPAWGRIVVSMSILACLAFVAWAWTENHLLSLRGQAAWTEQYESGGFFYGDREVLPRLLVWCGGAAANLAMVLGWQQRRTADAGRPLARLAALGLVAGLLAGLIYGISLPAEVRSELLSRGGFYLAVAVVGLGLQGWGWWPVWRGATASIARLAAITIGAVLTTTGMTTLRELRRLAAIDIADHYATHAKAAEVGGLVVFLLFLAINAGAIGWVLALVRRREGAAEA